MGPYNQGTEVSAPKSGHSDARYDDCPVLNHSGIKRDVAEIDVNQCGVGVGLGEKLEHTNSFLSYQELIGPVSTRKECLVIIFSASLR